METLQGIQQIYAAIAKFENSFVAVNRLSLNEAMFIQILSKGKCSATKISNLSGLSASNTSKVLRKLEQKWIIERVIDNQDRRKMNFSLTNEGKSLFNRIKNNPIEVPELIAQFINQL